MNISQCKKEDFQKAIMEKGFYPEDLPPCFEVSGFFDAAKDLKLFEKSKTKMKNTLELAKYNASKRGFQRRIFSYAHPLFYIRVASFLGKNRKNISKHLDDKGHYSCSIPRIDKSAIRAIANNSFSEFDKRKRDELVTFPYLIKIDTSRFYASLYTHAIPWAFHGKEEAKANTNNGNFIMNELDKILRDAQRGQTIGIPIGPDTSRIIAEIVSVAIDERFRKRFNYKVNRVRLEPKGIRLIDDIVFGAESESHAHKILNTYRETLQEFELDINEVKTKIVLSSQELEPYWVFTIKRDLESKKDLPNVLDHIIRVANEKNDDGIIRFAIKYLVSLHFSNEEQDISWPFSKKEWEIIEPFLMRVSMSFTHCLPYVVRLVCWAISSKKANNNKWKKICHLIIEKHALIGHDSEVAWACWLLQKLPYTRKLTKSLLNNILEKSGTIPALIALDIAKNSSKGIQDDAKQLVLNRLGDCPIIGSNWLLAYQCHRLFDFKLQQQDGFELFNNFIKSNVKFYKEIKPSKTVEFELDKLLLPLLHKTPSYDELITESVNPSFKIKQYKQFPNNLKNKVSDPPD
ncbi:RNA-directed DNA polymerase [Alphaproteobacteria bacterium]|nr:RNA-directed DNA polymerase [Alphaproteobacteria bacterium]